MEKLLKRKDLQINLVISRFPSGDKEIESLCQQNSIEYLLVENINDFFTKQNLSFDLGISVSYDKIFKSKTITSHKKVLINCHAGNFLISKEETL